MIKVTCPTCMKSVELEDRYAGRRARCACGTPIQIPRDAPRDGRTATSAALEEAMRVADGKPARRGEDRRSAGMRFQLTERQGYMLGGIAAAALVLTLAWSAVTPSSWESEHHDVLVTLKHDADALAAAGKTRAASDKYGQVIRLVAGVNLKSADLKKLVEEARAARGSLLAQNATLATEKTRP